MAGGRIGTVLLSLPDLLRASYVRLALNNRRWLGTRLPVLLRGSGPNRKREFCFFLPFPRPLVID